MSIIGSSIDPPRVSGPKIDVLANAGTGLGTEPVVGKRYTITEKAKSRSGRKPGRPLADVRLVQSSFRFSPEVHAAISAAANATGLSISKVIQLCVERALVSVCETELARSGDVRAQLATSLEKMVSKEMQRER